MRNRKRVGWHRYVNGVVISTIVTALFILLPLYWLIASSFKAPNDVGTTQLFPNPISGANYSNAFVGFDFGIYFRNSLVVTIIATALVLFLGTLAGYALGRLPMRGKFTTLVILLMISVFPEVAVIAPLFLLMKEIGWLNSYQALILPDTAFNLSVAIWIIILPQSLPGLFTAGIFCFTACWTEFLMALTFNDSNNFRTIPVGIADFGGNFQVPYGTIFAASVVGVGPHRMPVLFLLKF